ncbi:SMI1/KNR4 family protein [Rubritalea spongiae]
MSDEHRGSIQHAENYNITVIDENWDENDKLIHCPSWYAQILKEHAISGLFFLADVPDVEWPEEHIFLPLPSWQSVADDYPFFISEMHNHGHYPFASSGFGYLVFKDGCKAEDPIYRWDGGYMEFTEAFTNFSVFLNSIQPYNL